VDRFVGHSMVITTVMQSSIATTDAPFLCVNSDMHVVVWLPAICYFLFLFGH